MEINLFFGGPFKPSGVTRTPITWGQRSFQLDRFFALSKYNGIFSSSLAASGKPSHVPLGA
jgi:hypothetical protein